MSLRILFYSCLASLIAAMALDYAAIRPVLADQPVPDPIPFTGIVDILTRHDGIQVARYAMGSNSFRNWQKIKGYMLPYGDSRLHLNPNMQLRGVPTNWRNGGTIPFMTEGYPGSRFQRVFGVGGKEFTINYGACPVFDDGYKSPSVDGLLSTIHRSSK